MSDQFILALDQGTTSSRAILFDRKGQLIAQAQKEFQQFYPHPGWVEHDAEEIWSSQYGVLAEVLAKKNIGTKEVAAIGITNQRETTIVWDRTTGRPIHRAIVWQDRRTSARCAELEKSGHGPKVRETTGLVLDPYFSGTKIAWLLDNVPGARGRADKGELAFGTVDTYLVWRLTGGAVHVTDVTNASRTMLMGVRSLSWDEEMGKILRVPRAVLPEIVASAG